MPPVTEIKLDTPDKLHQNAPRRHMCDAEYLAVADCGVGLNWRLKNKMVVNTDIPPMNAVSISLEI